jgi:hypothetical protein
MLQTKWLQIVGFLIVIAPGTTVVSLTCNRILTEALMLINFGPVLATSGASELAFWVTSRG